MRKFRSITVRQLWAATLLVGIFIFVNTHPIRPQDFWWHMALGREISSTGQIPTVDTYSYTMNGQPYPSYQMFWLADIGLYALYSLGGPALVVFTQSLMITGTYLLIFMLCWKASRNWGATTLAMFFSAAQGIHNWNVRPQMISYLIGALFLYAIYAYRLKPSRKWLAVFPAGMLIWANSHGSFPIGFILIGIWLGDALWNALNSYLNGERKSIATNILAPLIALIFSGLACLINPRGIGIFTYVFSLSGNPIIQNLIPEWAAPTFDSQIGMIFYLGLLFCIVILALSPNRPSFFQLLTFVVFSLLAIVTTRGVVWFGLVMAPVLADHLSDLNGRLRKRKGKLTPNSRSSLINVAFLLLLLILAILSLPWFKHFFPFPKLKSGLISLETPVAATDFLKSQELAGNLFNDIGFGSYLIWAAYPDYHVFVDSRIELYPINLWWDYSALSNADPGWNELLERYEINTMLLNVENQKPLITTLEKSSSWDLIYRDPTAVIFKRITE